MLVGITGRTRRFTTASSAGAGWGVQPHLRLPYRQDRRARADHDRRDPPQGPQDRRQPVKKGGVFPDIGPTKGGLNSKLHAVCDGEGRPIMLLLSALPNARNGSVTKAMTATGSALHWPNAVSRPASRHDQIARSNITTTKPFTDSATKSRTSSRGSKAGDASQSATTAAHIPSCPPSPSPQPSATGCDQ